MSRSRFPLSIVALVLAGCSMFNEPEPAAVSLRTIASPTNIQLGDTARISIEITNVTNNTVEVGVPGCNMDFVIISGNGSVYHPAELVYCTLALYAPVQLAPGAKHVVNVFTTGRVVPMGSQAAPAMLPPATYRIRGVVYVVRGAQDALTVQSDPVSVTFR
jgi:hypothetical protein